MTDDLLTLALAGVLVFVLFGFVRVLTRLLEEQH